MGEIGLNTLVDDFSCAIVPSNNRNTNIFENSLRKKEVLIEQLETLRWNQ
jgi:hypothetical protein